jgi:hypothetical protein
MIKGNAGGSNGRAAEFRAGGKTKASLINGISDLPRRMRLCAKAMHWSRDRR